MSCPTSSALHQRHPRGHWKARLCLCLAAALLLMPSLSHAADESFFEDDEESVREYQPLLAETPTIRSPASHSVPSAAHHQAGSQPAETERKESSSSNNSNTGADGEQPSGTKRDEPLRIPPSGAKRGEAFSNPGAAAAPAERGFASGASPGKGDGFATLLVVVVLLLLSLSVGFREYRRIRKASRKTTLKQQLARIENVVAEICRALNMELDGTVNADTDTVNADTDTDTDAPVISYDTLMKRIDEQKSKVNSFLTGDHSASESNLTEQEKGLVRDAVLRDNSEAVDEAARASELRKILLLKSALEAAGQRCEQRRFEQRLMSAPAHARIPILERHADRGLALPPQIGVEQIREEHEKKSIKMAIAGAKEAAKAKAKAKAANLQLEAPADDAAATAAFPASPSAGADTDADMEVDIDTTRGRDDDGAVAGAAFSRGSIAVMEAGFVLGPTYSVCPVGSALKDALENAYMRSLGQSRPLDPEETRWALDHSQEAWLALKAEETHMRKHMETLRSGMVQHVERQANEKRAHDDLRQERLRHEVKSEADEQAAHDQTAFWTTLKLQGALLLAIIVLCAWQQVALPVNGSMLLCRVHLSPRQGSHSALSYIPGANVALEQSIHFICYLYTLFQRLFSVVLLVAALLLYYVFVSLMSPHVAAIVGSIGLLTFMPAYAADMMVRGVSLVLPAAVHLVAHMVFDYYHHATLESVMTALADLPEDSKEWPLFVTQLQRRLMWRCRNVPLRSLLRRVVHPALSIALAVECGLYIARGYGFLL